MRAEPDPEPPVEELGYREAMAELDGIVEELDGPAVDVDVVAVRFARAVELLDELDRRITETRARVDELAPRLARLADDDDRGDGPGGGGRPDGGRGVEGSASG